MQREVKRASQTGDHMGKAHRRGQGSWRGGAWTADSEAGIQPRRALEGLSEVSSSLSCTVRSTDVEERTVRSLLEPPAQSVPRSTDARARVAGGDHAGSYHMVQVQTKA